MLTVHKVTLMGKPEYLSNKLCQEHSYNTRAVMKLPVSATMPNPNLQNGISVLLFEGISNVNGQTLKKKLNLFILLALLI